MGKPLKVIFKINCHLRFVPLRLYFFFFCGHFKLNPFEIAQFTFPIFFFLLPRYTTPSYDILFLFRWDLFRSKSLSCRHPWVGILWHVAAASFTFVYLTSDELPHSSYKQDILAKTHVLMYKRREHEDIFKFYCVYF